jgi:GAF domain-containing protein
MATTQLLPVPPNEQERLAALRSLCVLDTPPEAPFEHLTALAATHFNVPIAAISLVDEHRQFFKSIQGTSIVETSRETSFCTYTLLSDDPLIVPDAQKDDRFRENALVVGEEHLRFYAGAPLITSGGMKLGSFCVIDRRPRPEFHMNHFRDLERFAAIASRLIEQRLLPETLRQTRELNAELQLRAETEITASQAKTDFLNNISHEIRTPMNGVLGMIQLLASTELSAEQRNYAKVAKSCGGMLVALLDDVLDLQDVLSHGQRLKLYVIPKVGRCRKEQFVTRTDTWSALPHQRRRLRKRQRHSVQRHRKKPRGLKTRRSRSDLCREREVPLAPQRLHWMESESRSSLNVWF